jgi:hypothetical protein
MDDHNHSLESEPVMFNFPLNTLRPHVPNEKLLEWENLLISRLGSDAMTKATGYSGGTISFCDYDDDGVITIATEACDCDYIA